MDESWMNESRMRMLCQMPDLGRCNEMKWIFFKSMPETWKDAFTSDGNNDISASTIESTKTFMKQQKAKPQAKMAGNKAKQSTDRKRDQSKERDNNKSKPLWKNSKKRKPNEENSSSSDHNQTGKCRRCEHDHLWKDCFCNPQNPNNKIRQPDKDRGRDALLSPLITNMFYLVAFQILLATS